MMPSTAAESSSVLQVEPAPSVVVLIVILCGLTTLFLGFGGRAGVFLFLDEFHSLANLDHGYGFLLSTFDARGSGMALPLLQRLSVDLLGDSLVSYRVPAVLGACGATLLCYPVAKRLVGPTPALITVVALASNSLFIYYSRLGRSYTLAVCVILVLVLALQTALESETHRLRRYGALALAIGFAPYVHLVTIGVIGAISSAALARLVARGEWLISGRWLLGSFAAGGLLAAILQLPAAEEIISFLREVVEGRGYSFVHDWTYVSIVAETLAGGRVASFVWWVGVPVASIWIWLERRSESLILLAAALSSAAVVSLLTPRGAPIAWARYLLVSLPFLLMLLAWLITRLLHQLSVSRPAAERLPLMVGGVLVAIACLFGPLGIHHADDGPFANGYLSTRPLVANDFPWPQSPSFYRDLGQASGTGVIIETPVLSGRSMYLYRNYFLQHGWQVLLGVIDVPEAEPAASVWPYVPLLKAGAIRDSGADYLIVHLNVLSEAVAYEAFVRSVDRTARALRSGTPGIRHGLLLSDYARDLERELGAPVYRDDKIVAWRLSGGRLGLH